MDVHVASGNRMDHSHPPGLPCPRPQPGPWWQNGPQASRCLSFYRILSSTFEASSSYPPQPQPFLLLPTLEMEPRTLYVLGESSSTALHYTCSPRLQLCNYAHWWLMLLPSLWIKISMSSMCKDLFPAPQKTKQINEHTNSFSTKPLYYFVVIYWTRTSASCPWAYFKETSTLNDFHLAYFANLFLLMIFLWTFLCP